MENRINNIDFPKVLIIGETLHKKTGSGITLFNFFAEWPKDQIAVLTGANIWESDVSLCYKYYLWKTENMILPKFLKRLFFKQKNISLEGCVSVQDILKRQDNKNNIQPFNAKGSNDINNDILKSLLIKIKLIYRFLIKIIGLSPLTQKIVITESLGQWINSYKPDVMYTFLNHYEQFQLVLDLHKKHGIPYVVHPMDDHIKLMPPKSLLFYYWKYKMNSKFEILIKNASVRLSICDYMSHIYKRKYKFDFHGYHNPIDADNWLQFSKTNWKINGAFKILYAGRYGFDNAELLHSLAQIVEELNKEGFNIKLDLRFGILSDKSLSEAFLKYEHSEIKDYVPHNEIKTVLPKYDLLFLPLGFDKKTRKIYSVSMSTKIPEYMISGTPIIVNAPENTAYFQYAQQDKWGYLLPTDNPIDLKNSLLKLIKNEQLRETLGKKAKIVAKNNHDAKKVRNDLRMEFIKAVSIN
jgi:glycosyltransferase involved in cell wall biosynthesis